MAVNPDPTTHVVTPVAEPGQTTTEYKVMIYTVVHDALVLGITLGLSSLGFHPSEEVKQLLFAEVGGVSTLATGYIISRGIRKSGTNA
jgi:hypothetical protein